MSTHTPGPWRLDGRMILGRAFDGTERAVCERVRGGNPLSADANARLIAAAPEMLAMLRRYVANPNETGLGFDARALLAKIEP